MKAQPVLLSEGDRKVYEYPGSPFQLHVYTTDTGRTHRTHPCEVWYTSHSSGLSEEPVYKKIGEFHYKYRSEMIKRIFHPFLHKDKWYCTYATSYTALSVACLENGFTHIASDVGGSEGSARLR